MLKRPNFLAEEGRSPLIFEHIKYLKNSDDRTQLLEEAQNIAARFIGDDQVSNNNDEYNVKTAVETDDGDLITRDSLRIFVSEKYQNVLKAVLSAIYIQRNKQYNQSMAIFAGKLLLYLEPTCVLLFVYKLAINPFYNFQAYWVNNRVQSALDANICQDLLQKVNKTLYDKLKKNNISLNMCYGHFVGELFANIISPKYYLIFLNELIVNGSMYLIKFIILYLKQLTSHIMNDCNGTKQIQKAILNEDESIDDAFWIKLFKASKHCGLFTFSLEAMRVAQYKKHEQQIHGKILDVWHSEYKIDNNDIEMGMEELMDCTICLDGFGEFQCESCSIVVCECCMKDKQLNNLHEMNDNEDNKDDEDGEDDQVQSLSPPPPTTQSNKVYKATKQKAYVILNWCQINKIWQFVSGKNEYQFKANSDQKWNQYLKDSKIEWKLSFNTVRKKISTQYNAAFQSKQKMLKLNKNYQCIQEYLMDGNTVNQQLIEVLFGSEDELN